MSSGKDHFPEFQSHVGAELTPDELDVYTQYAIIKPGTAANAIGTVAPGTVSGTFVIDNKYPDYPRNLRFSCPGAGAVGGTASVVYKDQFGVAGTESIGVATATSGGTADGTVVMAEITSASFTFAGTGNSTPALGYDIAAGALFGLPIKVGGTADLKRVTWIDNGVATPNGTPNALVDTDMHAFKTPAAVAVADDFILLAKSSYDASGLRVQRLSNL